MEKTIVYARSGKDPFDEALAAAAGDDFTVLVTETLSRNNPVTADLVVLDTNFTRFSARFAEAVQEMKDRGQKVMIVSDGHVPEAVQMGFRTHVTVFIQKALSPAAVRVAILEAIR